MSPENSPMPDGLNRSSTKYSSTVGILMLLILLATGIVQITGTYSATSHTWDEPAHLAAGMELIDRGSYGYEPLHPPLARWFTAIGPYLKGVRAFGEPNMWREGLRLLYDGGDYHQTLMLARAGVLPFFILLVIVVWVWSRRLAGQTAAALGVFFVVTQPVILAHSALATTDLPATALCLFSLYAFIRWLQNPEAWRLAAMGAGVGFAVMAKFSSIPFLAVGFVAIMLCVWLSPFSGRLGEALGSLSASYIFLVVVALFTTSWAAHQFAWSEVSIHLQSDRDVISFSIPSVISSTYIGVHDLISHSKGGHFSYLLGSVSQFGWWYYFPVAIAVKASLPLLLLSGCGIFLLARKRLQKDAWVGGCIVGIIVAILAFCAFSTINIGVRHVLLIFPLLAILAGYGATKLFAASRPVKVAVVSLLVWQALSSAMAYPEYLSWFNLTASGEPEKVLINGDLDWGQDLNNLTRAAIEHDIPYLSIAYNGVAWFERHALPAHKLLQPGQSVTGWVAISLWSREAEHGYEWLKNLSPVTRVGASIDLYYVEPEDLPVQDRASAKMAEALFVRYDLNQAAASVPLFETVLRLHPNHYGALWQLASALEVEGSNQKARGIWSQLLPLARSNNDPTSVAEITSKIDALTKLKSDEPP